MDKTKITPKVVKTIESALEERKKGNDRRHPGSERKYDGTERRSGRDRRDTE